MAKKEEELIKAEEAFTLKELKQIEYAKDAITQGINRMHRLRDRQKFLTDEQKERLDSERKDIVGWLENAIGIDKKIILIGTRLIRAGRRVLKGKEKETYTRQGMIILRDIKNILNKSINIINKNKKTKNISDIEDRWRKVFKNLEDLVYNINWLVKLEMNIDARLEAAA